MNDRSLRNEDTVQLGAGGSPREALPESGAHGRTSLRGRARVRSSRDTLRSPDAPLAKSPVRDRMPHPMVRAATITTVRIRDPLSRHRDDYNRAG